MSSNKATLISRRAIRFVVVEQYFLLIVVPTIPH